MEEQHHQIRNILSKFEFQISQLFKTQIQICIDVNLCETIYVPSDDLSN